MLSVSVVIPMHNEEANAEKTIRELSKTFKQNKLEGEVIVVDDRSTDSTPLILNRLARKNKLLRVIHRKGDLKVVEVGYAVRDGIALAKYDVVVVMMGDLSDDPKDISRMVREIEKGYDFVVGSRFCEGGKAYDYPLNKLIANRLCNSFTKLIFNLDTNDISNAFKSYRRSALRAIEIESRQFNFTVEIPLKLIKKGYCYTQIPVKWFGRKRGVAKLKVWSSAFAYFKTVLKIFLNK